MGHRPISVTTPRSKASQNNPNQERESQNTQTCNRPALRLALTALSLPNLLTRDQHQNGGWTMQCHPRQSAAARYMQGRRPRLSRPAFFCVVLEFKLCGVCASRASALRRIRWGSGRQGHDGARPLRSLGRGWESLGLWDDARASLGRCGTRLMGVSRFFMGM